MAWGVALWWAAAATGGAQERVPIDTVMARVYAYAATQSEQITPLSTDVYTRHYLRTRRRGFWVRYVPGLFRLERGVNDYFGESLARYRLRPGGSIERKVLAAYTTMPYLQPANDQWVGRYNVSVYAPNLFTDRILSPLNRRNRRFYRYQYLYTYMRAGRAVAHVGVRPRINNTQLVEGTFDVELATGQVRLFSFRFHYGWTRLLVEGELGEAGAASFLPGKLTLVSHLNWLGNRFDERFEASLSHDLSAPPPPDTLRRSSRFDLTEQSLLRNDTTSMRRDRAYFDSQRPYPLMAYQQAIYERREALDSLRQAERDSLAEAQPVEEKPARRERYARAEDLLFGSHTFSLTSAGRVKLPPILTPSMLQWSRSKGLSLQTRIAFNFDLGAGHHLSFSPRVGYSFNQRQWYWRVPLRLTLLPRLDGTLGIEAAGGDRMYSSRQADEVRRQMQGLTHYDSLVSAFDRYDFHYYRDQHALLHFGLQPVVGLRLSMGLRFHHRTLLHWNEVAASNGMDRTRTSLAPRLRVEWTPAQYYYRIDERPVPLHSYWPTFVVDYERSISALDRATSYERVEMDTKFRLPLYALRSLYLQAGAGFFTRRGEDCFFDYDNFRNNTMPQGWDDEMIGEFQLLDARFYNESRYYARLSASYESPMLLFSRLPLLTRLVQKERVYGNLLSVRRLPFYSEWGYGMSTPLLDVAGFVAIAGHGQTSAGCKVVIRLFDD